MAFTHISSNSHEDLPQSRILFKIFEQEETEGDKGGIGELHFGLTHRDFPSKTSPQRNAKHVRNFSIHLFLCAPLRPLRLCGKSEVIRKETEGDKWRDRRASLWPHRSICEDGCATTARSHGLAFRRRQECRRSVSRSVVAPLQSKIQNSKSKISSRRSVQIIRQCL